jgi:hypothetical protein
MDATQAGPYGVRLAHSTFNSLRCVRIEPKRLAASEKGGQMGQSPLSYALAIADATCLVSNRRGTRIWDKFCEFATTYDPCSS